MECEGLETTNDDVSTSKMTVGGTNLKVVQGTKADNFQTGLGWEFKALGRKREPAAELEAGASERSVTGTSSLVRHASRVTALTVHPHGHTLVYSNNTINR